MNTMKRTARLAGGLYLAYIVISILADVAGRSKLIVFGNAAATAANVAASGGLFRLSLVSDLAGAVLFLLTAWALYVLLKPVNQNLALLFVLLNLGGVAVWSINLLNQLAAQLLLDGAGYSQVFPASQQQALAMFFLQLQKDGIWVAQAFFGAWLFPLGYLVFKSGFLPKVLGVVLMVHCVVWLMTFLQFFLFPGLGAITKVSYPLGVIAEFGLSLWLLVMGAQERRTASVGAD